MVRSKMSLHRCTQGRRGDRTGNQTRQGNGAAVQHMSVNEHAQPIVGAGPRAGSKATPEKPATPALTDAREASDADLDRGFFAEHRRLACRSLPCLILERSCGGHGRGGGVK